MPENFITQQNLGVLKSPSLALPRVRQGGQLDELLESTFSGYLDALGELDGPLSEVVDVERIRTLADSLVSAWRRGWAGDLHDATALLGAGLDQVEAELTAISGRQEKILSKQSWYRLAAWDGVSQREHLFHTPFELEQHAYRFSAPGSPSLYLANSVYLCWLECGEPDVEKCFISRFEIDASGFDMLHVPANTEDYVKPLEVAAVVGDHPRSIMNSPYDGDVTRTLAEFLTVWPLIAATTMRKIDIDETPRPEYVIPQLLMLWIRDSTNQLGLRYLTSKDDPSTNSQDMSINLALPARQNKTSGYCEFLASRARWTEPQPLTLMANLTVDELATEEAADCRQSRSGRYMLRRDGEMTHYFATEFGKMEYWLDRPELELGSI